MKKNKGQFNLRNPSNPPSITGGFNSNDLISRFVKEEMDQEIEAIKQEIRQGITLSNLRDHIEDLNPDIANECINAAQEFVEDTINTIEKEKTETEELLASISTIVDDDDELIRELTRSINLLIAQKETYRNASESLNVLGDESGLRGYIKEEKGCIEPHNAILLQIKQRNITPEELASYIDQMNTSLKQGAIATIRATIKEEISKTQSERTEAIRRRDDETTDEDVLCDLTDDIESLEEEQHTLNQLNTTVDIADDIRCLEEDCRRENLEEGYDYSSERSLETDILEMDVHVPKGWRQPGAYLSTNCQEITHEQVQGLLDQRKIVEFLELFYESKIMINICGSLQTYNDIELSFVNEIFDARDPSELIMNRSHNWIQLFFPTITQSKHQNSDVYLRSDKQAEQLRHSLEDLIASHYELFCNLAGFYDGATRQKDRFLHTLKAPQRITRILECLMIFKQDGLLEEFIGLLSNNINRYLTPEKKQLLLSNSLPIWIAVLSDCEKHVDSLLSHVMAEAQGDNHTHRDDNHIEEILPIQSTKCEPYLNKGNNKDNLWNSIYHTGDVNLSVTSMHYSPPQYKKAITLSAIPKTDLSQIQSFRDDSLHTNSMFRLETGDCVVFNADPKDGNCLLYSIGICLDLLQPLQADEHERPYPDKLLLINHKQTTYHQFQMNLRGQITHHIITQWSYQRLSEEFIDEFESHGISEDSEKDDITAIIQAQILTNNIWLSNREISALMEILNRPIAIIDNTGSCINSLYIDETGFRQSNEPLLIHWDGTHYSALTVEEDQNAKLILEKLLKKTTTIMRPSHTHTSQKSVFHQRRFLERNRKKPEKPAVSTFSNTNPFLLNR